MPASASRVDRLWPDPQLDLELEAEFGLLRLPAVAGRPVVGLNMVASLDGRAQSGGGSDGLSNGIDRRVMRWLRAAYDAVASGAGTLRQSGLWPGVPAELAHRRAARGRSPQPTEVLVAGSGELPLEASWFRHEARRIVMVGAQSPHSAPGAAALPAGTELLIAPEELPQPRWILDQLGRRGVGSVLLEGGPTLNAAFLAADLIDETYLTVTAKLIGSDALATIAPVPGGSPFAQVPRQARLVSVHRAGDDLYLRHRFTTRGQEDSGS